MYICICNPTTNKEIIQCCKDGCSLEELKLKLNVCQNCKCCEEEVDEIYNSQLLLQIT